MNERVSQAAQLVVFELAVVGARCAQDGEPYHRYPHVLLPLDIVLPS